MSRSGYSEDLEPWDLIRWRGQVASAIRGQRGQQCLREMLGALDAMPIKRLIPEELETADGEVCALGALGKARGIDMSSLDPEDYDAVAEVFRIPHQLAREIVYVNDDGYYGSPEARFIAMRFWIIRHLNSPAADGAGY